MLSSSCAARWAQRRVPTMLVIAILLIAGALAPRDAARAQSTTAISGTVESDGKPVAGAAVRLQGNNLTRSSTTDAHGRFAFPGLSVGAFQVQASKGELRGTVTVDLTATGANVVVPIAQLRTIGKVVVVRAPSTQGSGTNVALNSQQLTRLPNATTLPSILTQLPSAARGSNGQIHINGDHNGLNYYIDGVQVPAGLNRVLGAEVDPADIGFLDAIEGAYPAQYGDRFGAVLNIGTRSFTGPAGANGELQAGSYNLYDGILNTHAPVGQGGSVVLSGRFQQDGRAIDPSTPNAPHDTGSDTNQFLRFSMPVHKLDTINLDLVHSLQTFQIPPDLAHGAPATTDDNEYQNDTFSSLQYRHAIGDRGAISFGPSFKNSRILDTNDLANDLAPAAGTTCTDFTDCNAYSVFADRTEQDYRFNVDYALRSSEHHEVRYGALYGTALVPKHYVITLQPGNQLNPSGGAFVATDDNPNVAHQQEAYIQDSWRMGSRYQLDYGLRMDAFQIFSTNYDNGFSQWSPRVKFTRFFGSRASAYVYYGRLFVPFSFENVNPATAASLYTAQNNPGVTFDLKPERDSLYEAGGHLPLGSGELGVRISHKVATDWIDDTQVGATNLHQDINFPQGRVDLQSLYFQQPLRLGSRLYLSLTHSNAVNSANCETQLLQNCAASGPPGGPFVQADHDQRVDATSGILLNDARGGWFSFSAEYGSGLSKDPTTCSTGDTLNCKVPPHLVFNAEKGFALPNRSVFTLTIENLFNDRYAITLDNALQGTHYARPRSFLFGYQFGGF